MNIHIVGIAGSMTAPLAIALKKQGHEVTGSDQQRIYPPFSTQLKNAKIPINKTSINKKIDLAIIGSSYLAFSHTKEEFLEIKAQKIPYLSATKYISQFLIKQNSILVAGSYGKTTISAALCYLFTKAKFNPSYMFGGQGLNRQDSLHFSNSDYSVVEADESINGLDTKAKFLYYPVKYLILTSALWEHKDSYQSEADNFNAFKQLIQNIPKDGILIYNQNDKSIKRLLPFAICPTIPYTQTSLQNKLIGKYNQQNLAAVEVLAKYLKINPKIITVSFKSFKGIKRRLEIKAKFNNLLFIDDYAQGATRIKAALLALKNTFPDKNIKVFYEPHASFLQHRSNLKELSTVFNIASEIVIYRLKFIPSQKASDRLCAKDYLSTIPHSLYIPLRGNVLKHYQNTLKSGDILIHFSSGGEEGLITFQKIIRFFKKNNVKINY